MTKTRIPRNLKKKLETSLENLSPTEAGRLFVIYAKEAVKKGTHPDEYPPIEDLVEAMQSGNPKTPLEERLAVNRYNGFFLLSDIFRKSNQLGTAWVDRLAFEALRVTVNIDNLLRQDAISDVARMIRSGIYDDIPKPVRPVQYKMIQTYATEEAIITLDEAAESIALAWAEDQGFGEPIVVPFDFKRSLYPEETYTEETEEIRRKWVAHDPDRILADEFGFDEDTIKAVKELGDDWLEFGKLGDWIRAGGDPNFTDDALAEKTDEFFDALVTLVEKGEIRGSKAVYLPRAEGHFFIEDGKIPAPFALRAIWETWVVDQGFRIHDFTLDDVSIGGIGKIYGETGDFLSKKEVLKLVDDFLAHCRRRPWGTGIPTHYKADDRLLRLLVEEPTPLIQIHCDDHEAMIDYDAFRKAEGFREARFDPFPAAMTRDLRIAAPKVAGVNCEVGHGRFYATRYYPTDQADEQRRNLHRLVTMIDQIDTTRRTFTYGKDAPLSSVFGAKFVTPLEKTVDEFRDLLASIATFKASLETISNRYFEGLDLALSDLHERIDQVDEIVDQGRNNLDEWLDRLDAYPWNVDTSSLRIGEIHVAEEILADFVDSVIRVARRDLKTPDNELGIGEYGGRS